MGDHLDNNTNPVDFGSDFYGSDISFSAEQNGAGKDTGAAFNQEDWNIWMQENIEKAWGKSETGITSGEAEFTEDILLAEENPALSEEPGKTGDFPDSKKSGTQREKDQTDENNEPGIDLKESGSRKLSPSRRSNIVYILICLIILELLLLLILLCRKKGLFFTSMKAPRSNYAICIPWDIESYPDERAA